MDRYIACLFVLIVVTQCQSTRFWNNTMKDYTPGAPLTLPQSTLDKMKVLEQQYIDLVLKNVPPSYLKNGWDCFEGTCGTSITFLRLYRNYQDKRYLELAKQYIDTSVKYADDREGYIGFLRGPNGVWSVCTVVASLYGDSAMAEMCLQKLQGSVARAAITEVLYDEYDTGRAGILMCGSFVNDFFKEDVINRTQLVSIAYDLFEQGVLNSVNGVLYWRSTFHDYFMWGQNHGTTGVLQQFFRYPELMQNATVAKFIETTLDNFVEIQLPSGNFPTPLKAPYPLEPDVLLQWCHGSPAFLPVLSEGYAFFGHKRYLESINRASDDLWRRGLLTKGLMLCHGITGNAYMMLYVYQVAETNPKHLYRALQFQEYVVNHPEVSDPSQMRQPTPNAYLFYGSSYLSAVTLWSDILTKAESFNMAGFEITI